MFFCFSPKVSSPNRRQSWRVDYLPNVAGLAHGSALLSSIAPENTKADTTDEWELLGRIICSPGEQVAIIAV
ncbi:hypothetical protein SDJN02_14366, partial [Cucurbita argyrosperma subsp. argyrosperma]